jgi:hypothetical protein
LLPTNVTGTAVPRRPVLGVIDVNVGVVGAVTVKVSPLLVPPGAVTLTVLPPTVVVAEKVNVVVICESLTTVMGPTVPPATTTAVVPVRPLPKILTLIAPCPRTPVAGTIDVITGPVTLNGTALLVPPALVTVMLCAPMVAVVALVRVAVMDVVLTTVTPLTVRPFAGATTATVDPATKFWPVMVTGVALPRSCVDGLSDEMTGVPGFTTVKVTGVVAPVVVATVMLCAPNVEVADEIVQLAVIVVSFTTVKPV